ncbi:hypothetical protein Lesp02_61520 [Lentzea sp. NBRC 105346]|uniref:hypothetical protein n=1 Tax=Lentzea sp. NBRC 105346 TaxID=3032205 RepID=UPI002554635F|nr:hypothetical protein [Lentzea sp. NBRC 105346]GLZ33964.1 hypothetical protein Lesp02_61520 [Lentzea sp. NBRC 105346]
MSDNFYVGVDELRQHARVWENAAANLRGPIYDCGVLELTSKEMSFAAEEHKLVQGYNDARRSVEKALQVAMYGFTAIQNQLMATAKTYEDEEYENLHRIEGTQR